MSHRWISRRGLFGLAEGKALPCITPGEMYSEDWLRTVEPCIEHFLQPGESSVGDGCYRLIYRGEEIVGHIEVTEQRPQP